MITALLMLAAALAMAVLSAWRGSGAQWLRYGMAAVAGAVSWLAGSDPVSAAAVGVGLFVFLVQPWGRWYSVGRLDRDILNPSDDYERLIERISDAGGVRRDWLAWWMSAKLFALPLAVLASPWWLILPPLMIAIYDFSWRNWNGWVASTPIRLAEFYKGAVLGLLCVLLAGCAATYTERSPYWSGVSREIGERARD